LRCLLTCVTMVWANSFLKGLCAKEDSSMTKIQHHDCCTMLEDSVFVKLQSKVRHSLEQHKQRAGTDGLGISGFQDWKAFDLLRPGTQQKRYQGTRLPLALIAYWPLFLFLSVHLIILSSTWSFLFYLSTVQMWSSWSSLSVTSQCISL
jgi:hypothetical protein